MFPVVRFSCAILNIRSYPLRYAIKRTSSKACVFAVVNIKFVHKKSIPASMQEAALNNMSNPLNLDEAWDVGVTVVVATGADDADDSGAATLELAAFSARAVGEARDTRAALLVIRKP